jgi:hypothetical protein
MSPSHPFRRFGSEFSIAGVDPKQKSDLRLLCVDTVEKLDFLPRSQFLRQQAGFKNKALRVSAERLTFRCAAAELVMATCGAVGPA